MPGNFVTQLALLKSGFYRFGNLADGLMPLGGLF